MKKIGLILLLIIIVFSCNSFIELHAAEPESVRCFGIQPICPPGKHPLCICESDYSINCGWICAGY